jgi:hypothetical protein
MGYFMDYKKNARKNRIFSENPIGQKPLFLRKKGKNPLF